MSNANKDDKLVSLRATFGMWGIGVYWNLIEFVAEQVKEKSETAEATLIVSELLGFFGCKRNKLETFLEHSQNVELFTYTLDGNILKINIPKMLDYADNYIKYEGKSLKTIQRQKEMSSKQDKNRIDKNRIEEYKITEVKITYGEFVELTEKEHQKLVEKYGDTKTNGFIEILDNYLGQSEKNRLKYTSHYRAILNWVVDEYDIRRLKKTGNTQPLKPDPPMVRQINKCISCFRPIPDGKTICEECDDIKKNGKVVDISKAINDLANQFKA